MTYKFFKAQWCATCEPVLVRVREIAKDQGHNVEVLDVAQPEGQREASRLHVGSLPTLIVLDGEKPLRSLIGTSIPRELDRYLRELGRRI